METLPRTQTSLSLDENVRAKEGGKETGRDVPSHGPLRFITSHLREIFARDIFHVIAIVITKIRHYNLFAARI